MSQIKVLIVDDSPEARDGLRSILTSHPDIVVTGLAESGEEAASLAEQTRPDVVLMDSQMPGMDGGEATKLLKARIPGIKVLYLVVHTGYIDEAIDCGADRCLMKDCGRAVLLNAVRELASDEAGGQGCNCAPGACSCQ